MLCYVINNILLFSPAHRDKTTLKLAMKIKSY